MKAIRRIIVALAAAALAACQTSGQTSGQTVSPPPSLSIGMPSQVRGSDCDSEFAVVDRDFITGAFVACNFADSNHVVVDIAPEDAPPINCSPWYAMRIEPHHAVLLTVDLSYEACGHRYWPKISTDGRNWEALPAESVLIYEVGGIRQARLSIPIDDTVIYLAGQEVIGPAEYATWFEEISDPLTTQIWSFGVSAEGRDIPAMTIVADGAAPTEHVLLIGRQHPPEVTGFFALKSFVETILADTPLSMRFRERFEVTLVPMLNPDGVVRGYWRHSTGHLDLNRDWGPFTQPETQLMDGFLRAMEADPAKQLRLFIDFHSTRQDVFYTIPDDQPTDPAMFTSNWLSRLQQRMPEYVVNRDSNHNPESATSKSHVFKTYGVPTTTFEIGDETDRSLIADIGREAAIAMMQVLLESPIPSE